MATYLRTLVSLRERAKGGLRVDLLRSRVGAEIAEVIERCGDRLGAV